MKQLLHDVGTKPTVSSRDNREPRLGSERSLASSKQKPANVHSCPLLLETPWTVWGYNHLSPETLVHTDHIQELTKRSRPGLVWLSKASGLLATPWFPLTGLKKKKTPQWFWSTYHLCSSSSPTPIPHQLPDGGKSCLLSMSSSCVTRAPIPQPLLVWSSRHWLWESSALCLAQGSGSIAAITVLKREHCQFVLVTRLGTSPCCWEKNKAQIYGWWIHLLSLINEWNSR